MSIGYCKKCKLIYREAGTCVCGRRLNIDNEQYLDAYLEHGYALHTVEPIINDEKHVDRKHEITSNINDLQDKRRDRREEKKRLREKILSKTDMTSTSSDESDFDTGSFLSSLGLRRKNSDT